MFRHHRVRDHEQRITGPGGEIRSVCAGRQNCVQMVVLQRRIDAPLAAQQLVFRHIGVIAGAIRFHVHLFGNIDSRLSVFDRAGFGVGRIPLLEVVQGLDGRGGDRGFAASY